MISYVRHKSISHEAKLLNRTSLKLNLNFLEFLKDTPQKNHLWEKILVTNITSKAFEYRK